MPPALGLPTTPGPAVTLLLSKTALLTFSVSSDFRIAVSVPAEGLFQVVLLEK